jgi:O-antigen biosynthesis protein
MDETWDEYRRWITTYEPILIENSKDRCMALVDPPLISVVVPTFNTSVDFLSKALESVRNQTYENWELCIADDGSTNSETLEYLRAIKDADERIQVVFRQSNGHISIASNTAVEIARGEWVALLDHDDQLAPHALATVALSISENPDSKLIYSDRDMIDASELRYQPFFKPDFDPELILEINYLTHLMVIRRDVLVEIGGFREGYEGSQDWDVALRVIERSELNQIAHVPHVLYHWRLHEGSVSSSLSAKPYASKSAQDAVQESLNRTHRKATATPLPGGGWFRISPEKKPMNGRTLQMIFVDDTLQSEPGQPLDRSVGAIEEWNASYSRHDDIRPYSFSRVVDSRVGYPSLAHQLNQLVSETSDDFYCIFNPEQELPSVEKISELLTELDREEIGAIGPLIVDASDKVLHSGYNLGIGGICGEMYYGAPEGLGGVYGRLEVQRNVAALDRSCLFFKRDDWVSVGGFSESDAPNFFCEIDFCLRLRSIGLQVIWSPFTTVKNPKGETFTHRFDVTEHRNQNSGFNQERTLFEYRWSPIIQNDPTFNPNLSFSYGNSGFDVAWPPRCMPD